MNVQTLCKDENANNPYNQNINLVFPSGIGMITGTASTVDLNVNSGNPCGNQVHPTFDATLFSPQELQFGLHIKNKINKWNFSQVANLDSISLIFETLTSSRKINIYEDKITICDGEIESPIVTLTDLFTIGLVDNNGNPNTNSNGNNLQNENDALKLRVTELENQVANIQQQISDILIQINS